MRHITHDYPINCVISSLLDNKSMKLLLVLLCAVLAFSFSMKKADDGKVIIDYYFESLCPYCQQFLEGGVKKALGTKDIWKISDFNLHPYGNAKSFQNGSSWSFTCQHGVRECEGNMVQLCALNDTTDYYGKGLPFVICLESDTSNWNTSGQRCANQYGLNWASIQTCAYGPKGIQLHYEEGVRTNALVPPHTYVPWIVVNGRHDAAQEQAARSDLVSFICKTYTGSIKIDACK